MKLSKRQKIGIVAVALSLTVAAAILICRWYSPTRILVVNPLPAQAAEMLLNDDSRLVDVECVKMEEASNFSDYDAVLMYGRGLYLDSLQMKSLEKAAGEGVKIYTNALRNFSFVVNHNLDSEETETLNGYFRNPCRDNYVNLLKYVRAIATPRCKGYNDYSLPVELPSEMFYHLEGGKYFKTAEGLTDYLKEKGLYNDKGRRVAFISGITFPVEGNRQHIDTLITRLTGEGYNVYPLSAKGKKRERMIREVNPDAIVYLPMGKLGGDTLINWCYERGIPLFMPFPLTQPREKWLDSGEAIGGGTLSARVVVPEIDGAMTPLCVSTQDPDERGFLVYTPDRERINAFIEQFTRFMSLKTKPNREKRVAIGYFKSPGKDALLASGMEVVPSLYNFLLRLKKEGYDVSGLPGSYEEFKRDLMKRGAVMGDYAPGAQKKFMDECNPLWIHKSTYESWAKSTLLPEKYAEIESRYGKAPGTLLARGDSIAVAALRYGNILLFPQPRPAIGDDDFRLQHGLDVAPPHSYLAPYLYVGKEFDADALIHFGTHGNLEFTPGKNVGLSQADWAEVLLSNRPHFYFYTTGNIGEAVIAKRRSHAVLVSHLTAPYVESGMRSKLSSLLGDIHAAISNPDKSSVGLKKRIIEFGVAKDLRLDSTLTRPFSKEELETIDSFLEELANEKTTGASYVMGRPYGKEDLKATLLAIAADRMAYERGKKDYEEGRITETQLHDSGYIRHHYQSEAVKTVIRAIDSFGGTNREYEMVADWKEKLLHSPEAEFDAMLGALSGRPVRPAPGGDPVLSPNVLPTGRNMYGINAEATPGEQAWEKGVELAEQTLEKYKGEHGDYPRQVTYTFWAGEFISTQGATLAQAFRSLGVEPVRDDQGRVIDLKLTPSKELGRPRVNVMVQVSGQLRDIAGSRLKMLADAVKLAAFSKDDVYPNYVAETTKEQETNLLANGYSPENAKRLSTARVFGPVNNGYGSGMLSYTENSGEWDDRKELADGFVNNMCAVYGDTTDWGAAKPAVFTAAVKNTDVIVQPRQSNTWGPVSLDHVYEYSGGLSLVASSLSGKEPDAVMSDYRNPYQPKVQDLSQGVAVEMRSTLLNPTVIKERMKGEATTAQTFGEMFRNVFGWNVMRPSALNEDTYDELYDMYVADVNGLGIEEYFDRVNPAALQEMTATMLEAARKGYWKGDADKVEKTAEMHAELTKRHGAPCTEFVCGNAKLTHFVCMHLKGELAEDYNRQMREARGESEDLRVEDGEISARKSGEISENVGDAVTAVSLVLLAVAAAIIIYFYTSRKNRNKNEKDE